MRWFDLASVTSPTFDASGWQSLGAKASDVIVTGFDGGAGGAPVFCEFAGDGGLEERSAEDFELLSGLLQSDLAFGDFGEERVDAGDDAALFGEGRKGD